MKNIYWRNMPTLGEAIFAAKCSVITWYPTDDYYYGPAVLYTMFGDPALRLKRNSPTAITEHEPPGAIGQLIIRPNPVHGSTAVSFPARPTASARIVVYDASGSRTREVRAGLGAPSIRLDCSGWSPGIYFVTLPGSGFAARKLVVR
jgi:hypothetical protein